MIVKLPPNLTRLSHRISEHLPGAQRGLKQVLREASTMIHAPWVAPTPFATANAGKMSDVAAFGDNPGRLRMLLHVPPVAPRAGAPLVVVLHGCGQHAAQFAADTGWVALADRLGFPLVLPEQVSENNSGRCFNWFQSGDTVRDKGEARSIREMVAEAVRRFRSDERRIFVVGLSAGGGMAAALLAAYPDVFAGGAVVAGLPVGAATNVASALSVMGGRDSALSGPEWAARAHALAPVGYEGPWPRMAIWHGTADHTVAVSNAESLATQWAALTGISAEPTRDAWIKPDLRRRRWGAGTAALESWTVEGMAHGYPIGARDVADRFVLRASVDATEEIAAFWELLDAR